MSDRPCTCHPDDNPPVPCAKRYALTECKAAAYESLRSRLVEAERDMDQLIGERDHAQGMADKLADAIATLLGVEIGEHSNMNCPWTQALEAFEDRPTVSADAALNEIANRPDPCAFGHE